MRFDVAFCYLLNKLAFTGTAALAECSNISTFSLFPNTGLVSHSSTEILMEITSAKIGSMKFSANSWCPHDACRMRVLMLCLCQVRLQNERAGYSVKRQISEDVFLLQTSGTELTLDLLLVML